jgi:hypothetical protein
MLVAFKMMKALPELPSPKLQPRADTSSNRGAHGNEKRALHP